MQPKERKVIKDFYFELTEKDRVEKSNQLGELFHEKSELTTELEVTKNRINPQVKDLDGRISHVLGLFDVGRELRTVECMEKFDYATDKVEYIFEGEVMDSRAMNDADRQLEFDTAGVTVQ